MFMNLKLPGMNFITYFEAWCRSNNFDCKIKLGAMQHVHRHIIKFQSKSKIGWKPRDLGAADLWISWLAGSCSGLPRWDCWPVWRPKLRTTSVLARQAKLQDTVEVVSSMWAGPLRHAGGRTWFCVVVVVCGEIVLKIAPNYSEVRILWSVACCATGAMVLSPQGEGKYAVGSALCEQLLAAHWTQASWCSHHCQHLDHNCAGPCLGCYVIIDECSEVVDSVQNLSRYFISAKEDKR